MWEVVTDDQGRQYYWNVVTDEVSWEVPPCEPSKSSLQCKVQERSTDAVHVRTRLSTLDGLVCLQLKVCREKHLMTDRLWMQLKEREREFSHMARSTRIATLDLYLNAHYQRLIAFALRSWERTCAWMRRRELERCLASAPPK